MTEVRQSGFSLSGEICKHSFHLISEEDGKRILEQLLNNLDTGESDDSVCMYVCYVCMHVCMRLSFYVCMYVGR